MKKFYIEVVDLISDDYILQSKWYDTENQAIEWAKGIDYMDRMHTINLLSANWDEENKTYGDICFERCLDRELGL